MSSRALNGMASIPCNQFICWRRSIGDKMRSLRSDLSHRPLFSGLLQKKRIFVGRRHRRSCSDCL